MDISDNQIVFVFSAALTVLLLPALRAFREKLQDNSFFLIPLYGILLIVFVFVIGAFIVYFNEGINGQVFSFVLAVACGFAIDRFALRETTSPTEMSGWVLIAFMTFTAGLFWKQLPYFARSISSAQISSPVGEVNLLFAGFKDKEYDVSDFSKKPSDPPSSFNVRTNFQMGTWLLGEAQKDIEKDFTTLEGFCPKVESQTGICGNLKLSLYGTIDDSVVTTFGKLFDCMSSHADKFPNGLPTQYELMWLARNIAEEPSTRIQPDRFNAFIAAVGCGTQIGDNSTRNIWISDDKPYGMLLKTALIVAAGYPYDAATTLIGHYNDLAKNILTKDANVAAANIVRIRILSTIDILMNILNEPAQNVSVLLASQKAYEDLFLTFVMTSSLPEIIAKCSAVVDRSDFYKRYSLTMIGVKNRRWQKERDAKMGDQADLKDAESDIILFIKLLKEYKTFNLCFGSLPNNNHLQTYFEMADALISAVQLSTNAEFTNKHPDDDRMDLRTLRRAYCTVEFATLSVDQFASQLDDAEAAALAKTGSDELNLRPAKGLSYSQRVLDWKKGVAAALDKHMIVCDAKVLDDWS